MTSRAERTRAPSIPRRGSRVIGLATGLEPLEVGEHSERVVVFVEEHVGHRGLLGEAARSTQREARFGELVAEETELFPLDVDAGSGLVPPEAKERATAARECVVEPGSLAGRAPSHAPSIR